MSCLGTDSIFNQKLIRAPLFECLRLLSRKDGACFYLCVCVFLRHTAGEFGDGGVCVCVSEGCKIVSVRCFIVSIHKAC